MGEIKKVVNEVLAILALCSPVIAVKASAKEAGESLKDAWRTGEDFRKKLKRMSDADIVTEAVNDLDQQWNADKDKVLDLNKLLRESYKRKMHMAIQSLRTQLGDDIILTGTWDEAEDMHELEESELLDGEMSAFVYKVGSYLVRQADCLYQDGDGIDYRERKPAGKDAIVAYMDASHLYICEPPLSYRSAKKISAKYIGDCGVPSEEWKCVCYEDHATSYYWSEQINFICAVKSGNLSSGSREELYVLKHWTGSSNSYDYWYRFNPDGTVEECRIYPLNNPFGIEASTEPWTWWVVEDSR